MADEKWDLILDYKNQNDAFVANERAAVRVSSYLNNIAVQTGTGGGAGFGGFGLAATGLVAGVAGVRRQRSINNLLKSNLQLSKQNLMSQRNLKMAQSELQKAKGKIADSATDGFIKDVKISALNKRLQQEWGRVGGLTASRNRLKNQNDRLIKEAKVTQQAYDSAVISNSTYRQRAQQLEKRRVLGASDRFERGGFTRRIKAGGVDPNAETAPIRRGGIDISHLGVLKPDDTAKKSTTQVLKEMGIYDPPTQQKARGDLSTRQHGYTNLARNRSQSNLTPPSNALEPLNIPRDIEAEVMADMILMKHYNKTPPMGSPTALDIINTKPEDTVVRMKDVQDGIRSFWDRIGVKEPQLGRDRLTDVGLEVTDSEITEVPTRLIDVTLRNLKNNELTGN